MAVRRDAVACLAIDAGFWFLAPRLEWYVGASGLLHGIFACGCLALLRQRDWIGGVSAVVFIAKLVWEQRVGPLPFEQGGAVVTVRPSLRRCGWIRGWPIDGYTSRMKNVFVFPGQGSQSVGMLAELAASERVVTDTFTEASEVLGYDLWNLVRNGPEELLNETVQQQPAMLVAGMATWRYWKLRGRT